MTAEIVVFNKSAIALAADSYVTITGPGEAEKVFEVNKLFTLSKHVPLGVMVYGNATLCGVPWETIIKMYRSHICDRSFETVKTAVTDLVSYLREQVTTFFPADQQQDWFRQVVSTVFSQLDELIDAEVRQAKEQTDDSLVDTSELPTLTLKTIQEFLSEIQSWEQMEWVDDLPSDSHETVKEEYSEILEDLIDSFFSKRELTTEGTKLLEDIAASAFFHSGVIGNYSGLVVAGFGEKELFPCVCTYNLFGVIANHLVWTLDEDTHKQSETHPRLFNGAGVIPFAQEDVAESFIYGVSQRDFGEIAQSPQALLDQFPELLEQILPEEYPERSTIITSVQQSTQQAADELKQSLLSWFLSQHFVPLMEVLAVLPKEELADLAEALVQLTSLKRKVSHGRETVGGPVDVAVISKGDGFVWIKRKHYFKPELNHSFFTNYLER